MLCYITKQKHKHGILSSWVYTTWTLNARFCTARRVRILAEQDALSVYINSCGTEVDLSGGVFKMAFIILLLELVDAFMW